MPEKILYSDQSYQLDEIRDHDSRKNFIDGDTDNPFARICCRERRLQPTPCDGTCGECKRAKEGYEKVIPATIVVANEIANAGDPDGEILSIDDARTILQNRLKRIKQAKEIWFLKRDKSILNAMQEKGVANPTLH